MTRALGIDVGSYSIKIAEIEFSSKSRELVGLYDLQRTSGDDVAKMIREFMESSQIKADRIAIGLGDAPVFSKRMEFPFSDSKKYLPAIQSEMEDTLPFDLNDYILDVQKVGKIQKLTQFLIGICPKTWVEKTNALCESAGIVPNGYYIDSEVMGEMALHQGLPASSEETSYCVVDFGHQVTKLAILKGFQKDPQDRHMRPPEVPGLVADFRSISHGSHELVTWIQERKSINADDAKQWLVHRAEINIDDDNSKSLAADLSEELKVALRVIVVEIYQAIQSFKSLHKSLPSALYLTGGMSGIKGLKEFLGDELRLPVHSWPIFIGYNTEKVPMSPEKELSFATALSLANRFVITKTGCALNFRRTQSSHRKILTSNFQALLKPEFRPLWASALGVMAFLITYTTVASHYLALDRADLVKSAAGEYRRLDKDAGKTADHLAAKYSDLATKFLEKKKLKSAELSTKVKAQIGVPKSQMLHDLSLALNSAVRLTSFISNGSGSPEGQFEATIAVNQTATDAEITKIKSQIEKPLMERGYSVGIEKLLTTKELKIKARIKGAKS